MDELSLYLQRMATANIASVAAEAYELIEGAPEGSAADGKL